MSNKREKDRESGTGKPIKSIPSKGGSGKGNWGSDQEQIKQGMDSINSTNANNASSNNRRKEPDSFGDLNDTEVSKPKQSWDEFNKKKGKKKAEVYSKKTVRSDYRKKYKPNKYEQETDAMFAGSSNKRNKKRKKKKKKVLLQTAVHYNEEPKARGRGRGSYGNNMRGGGYRGRGRGSYGGYNQQRGGGYGGYNNQRGGYRRGGGFGSRGRGSFNNEYDNNSNYQNQNQYQPNNNNSNNGQQQGQQQVSPNNANNANQDNVNIPVTVQ